MEKAEIIKKLQKLGYLEDYEDIKTFHNLETEKEIIFYYYHGDMGKVDRIIYYKNNGFTEIYDLDNYYGSTYLCYSLYI